MLAPRGRQGKGYRSAAGGFLSVARPFGKVCNFSGPTLRLAKTGAFG
jgi:hypothetical protein